MGLEHTSSQLRGAPARSRQQGEAQFRAAFSRRSFQTGYALAGFVPAVAAVGEIAGKGALGELCLASGSAVLTVVNLDHAEIAVRGKVGDLDAAELAAENHDFSRFGLRPRPAEIRGGEGDVVDGFTLLGEEACVDALVVGGLDQLAHHPPRLKGGWRYRPQRIDAGQPLSSPGAAPSRSKKPPAGPSVECRSCAWACTALTPVPLP